MSKAAQEGLTIVEPVKLLICELTSHTVEINPVEDVMEEEFGSIDYRGSWFPFPGQDYYAPEMGEGLQRRLVSFEPLFDPLRLASAKKAVVQMEERFAEAGKRRFNLDPGYLDFLKVVLASGKYAGHKVPVSRGIYADLMLYYYSGGFESLRWTFPDFKSGMFDEDLMEIRRIYQLQRRA